jgi:hypothetical protein
LAESNPAGHDNAKLTRVGCVVVLLTLAITLGVAIPIVRWRDPETKQSLPRMVAIITPLLIGATFQGICTVLLRLVGLRIWSRSEKEDTAPPDE